MSGARPPSSIRYPSWAAQSGWGARSRKRSFSGISCQSCCIRQGRPGARRRPLGRKFCVQFAKPDLSLRQPVVRIDRVDRADHFAEAAIRTGGGIDHDKIHAVTESPLRTDLDAIGVFAPDAGFRDDVGHGRQRPQDFWNPDGIEEDVRLAVDGEQHTALVGSRLMHRTRMPVDILAGAADAIVIVEGAFQHEALFDLGMLVERKDGARLPFEQDSHLALFVVAVKNLHPDLVELGFLPFHLGGIDIDRAVRRRLELAFQSLGKRACGRLSCCRSLGHDDLPCSPVRHRTARCGLNAGVNTCIPLGNKRQARWAVGLGSRRGMGISAGHGSDAACIPKGYFGRGRCIETLY